MRRTTLLGRINWGEWINLRTSEGRRRDLPRLRSAMLSSVPGTSLGRSTWRVRHGQSRGPCGHIPHVPDTATNRELTTRNTRMVQTLWETFDGSDKRWRCQISVNERNTASLSGLDVRQVECAHIDTSEMAGASKKERERRTVGGRGQRVRTR